MKIKVMVETGVPEKSKPCPKQSPEEVIQTACDLIESGHESSDEWAMIRRLNNKLMRKAKSEGLNKREVAILKQMQPVIEKYWKDDGRGIDRDMDVLSMLGKYS